MQTTGALDTHHILCSCREKQTGAGRKQLPSETSLSLHKVVNPRKQTTQLQHIRPKRATLYGISSVVQNSENCWERHKVTAGSNYGSLRAWLWCSCLTKSLQKSLWLRPWLQEMQQPRHSCNHVRSICMCRKKKAVYGEHPTSAAARRGWKR